MVGPKETFIKEQVEWLKKALTSKCMFCEEILEKEEVKELLYLPICEVCLSKYKLHKDLLIGKNQEQKEILWEKVVELVNNYFSNRCYFCEKFRSTKIEEDILFSLCEINCLPRYRIITNWKRNIEKGWY